MGKFHEETPRVMLEGIFLMNVFEEFLCRRFWKNKDFLCSIGPLVEGLLKYFFFLHFNVEQHCGTVNFKLLRKE